MTMLSPELETKMTEDVAVRKMYEQSESDKMVEAEKATIAGSEEAAKAKSWHGIALSGGGIRSSTFCTGILQALAHDDRLKNFDYMSSVSGGGFIGCSLRWWWHGTHGVKDHQGKDIEFGAGPDDFPYGTSDPRDPKSLDSEEQKANLSFLRNHGNYLAPGNGITLWSGLAVVVRTILLNLLVWIPIAVGLFYLLWHIRADWPILSWLFAVLPNGGSPLPESLIEARWEVLGEVSDNIRLTVADSLAIPSGFYKVLTLPPFFAILIWLSYLIMAVYLVGSLFFSIQSSRTQGAGGAKFTPSHWKWVWRALAMLFAAVLILAVFPQFKPDWFWVKAIAYGIIFFSLAILARMGIIWLRDRYIERKKKDEPDKDLANAEEMSQVYFLRRIFEWSVSFLFKYLLICLIIGFTPVIFKLVFGVSGMTGLLSLALGVAAALTSHAETLGNSLPGFVDKLLLPVGAGLLLFGVVLLGYQIAMILLEIDLLASSISTGMVTSGQVEFGTQFEITTSSFSKLLFDNLNIDAGLALQLLLAFLVAIAPFMAVQVNINQISLNRFYRDRLMEAYMPHATAVKKGKVEPTPADALQLRKLWKIGATGPYPLINTNCVLVNDDVQKVRLRGGDNYLLSPLYCGSTATRWAETNSPACEMLTLPTAMATSGAAANPNTGFVGTGPTRGRLVSLVMMLLSVRLGLWVLNPKKDWTKGLLKRPTHIRPGGQYALTNSGFKRDSDYLELSDGGHFDNSGLYELIRRKCAVIVACDGEADKEFGFASFVSLQRRAAEDFGVKFEFLDPDEGEPDYLPKNAIPSKELHYPKGALCAELPFFYAKIIYSDGSKGRLVYIKSTMIEDLSFTTRGYKAENPDFPHETTADQFFDPQQFEVYRELGYYAAKTTMHHFDEDWMPKKDPGPEAVDRRALADTPAEPTVTEPSDQKSGD